MGRGAPGSLKGTTALAIEIAKSYRRAFGIMPIAYPKGHFAKTFDAVMDIVSPEDESRDYSRAIKTAIQELNSL